MVDARACGQLSKTEDELARATAEFTAGLEARFGPVPCLHEAHDAMEAAVAALDRKNLPAGRENEETALAGLIRARQNLRKLLSDSKCASQCRKFDNQQKQKLRKPKDDKSELARLQEEIEKLAKEEKNLSEQLGSQGGSSQQESRESKQRLERQEKAAEKAEELRKKVRRDEGLTDLARERMDEAAGDVRDSADSLRKGRKAEAGQQAGRAAERLERLARQVAALKAPDVSSRLAQSQGMARQLAQGQQSLGQQLQGKESSKAAQAGKQAGDQRGMVEEARTLGDVLERLQQEAKGSSAPLGEALRQAAEANPPKAIVAQMQRAADLLKAGQASRARPEVEQSARMLETLAQQLGEAHRGLVQPQLAKLIAAEKQAAQTKQALHGVNSERQKAEAEKKVAQLRDTLEGLRQADPKLAEATAALADATRKGASWQHRDRPMPPYDGAYIPPVEYADNVKKVITVLQTKIQEIILRDALLDRDEPVPPQYKALVEEYYRVLSEDLR